MLEKGRRKPKAKKYNDLSHKFVTNNKTGEVSVSGLQTECWIYVSSIINKQADIDNMWIGASWESIDDFTLSSSGEIFKSLSPRTNDENDALVGVEKTEHSLDEMIEKIEEIELNHKSHEELISLIETIGFLSKRAEKEFIKLGYNEEEAISIYSEILNSNEEDV